VQRVFEMCSAMCVRDGGVTALSNSLLLRYIWDVSCDIV